MVIAHVIDTMDVGGAEAVVATLCRSQRAAGHRSSVQCLHHRGALGDQLMAEGFDVKVHGPASSLTIARRLWATFRLLQPDVVHCHNKSATVHAAVAARLSRAKVLVTTRHGMAAPPYRLRKELKFWLTAMLFCDRVVAVCDTARRNMMQGAGRAASGVVTIRNGAALPRFELSAVPSKGGFVLVSVGRLVAAKNYALLLRSVARARAVVPDVVLRLVGDGPELAALRQLARELCIDDVVQFHGERTDVGTLLRGADVFVLSSTSEGLPISILEAMSVGLPSIVTAVGGMPELIALCDAGVVVPAEDDKALASAVVTLAGRRHELSSMGARAAKCYGLHFTPQRMADDYQALYDACLR
jgi:glycosyltransferase involved in cell wall biosynthesis